MARKIFNFAIEIDGVDVILIQEVKKPKVELGSATHGGENGTEIKTSAGKTVGDAELMKIKPAQESDSWAWDLMMSAFGGNSVDYKKDVVFKELAPNGTTLNSYLWSGCWVKTTDDSAYKRGNQAENTIETITLSVDDVEKIQ